MIKSVERWWALQKKKVSPEQRQFWDDIDGHPLLFETRALADAKRKSDAHVGHHTRAVKVLLQED